MQQGPGFRPQFGADQAPQPGSKGPVNPISPVVVGLFLAMLLIEAAFSLGNQGLVGGPSAVGWRLGAVLDYGVSGDVFDLVFVQGRWAPELTLRYVAYLFVHASFTHMLVAGVMLLALGKFVGEAFAGWAVGVVFLVSGIGGAVVWSAVFDGRSPLIGAFPGVYGLVGAFSYVLWLRLGQLGENQLKAFILIGFLMGLQVLFGALNSLGLPFGGGNDWLANVAGFAIGFVVSFVVSPGGWNRLRGMLRHD